MAFHILLTTFFSKEFYLCMFVQFLLDFSKQKVRFAQVLAFSKVTKIEGEVFVALRASQGDLEHSRATISPQSPCSLTPVLIAVTHLIRSAVWSYSTVHAEKPPELYCRSKFSVLYPPRGLNLRPGSQNFHIKVRIFAIKFI